MTKYILLGDLKHPFFLNIIKAIVSLPDVIVHIITLGKDVVSLVFPKNAILYQFEDSNDLTKELNRVAFEADFIIGLDAVKYGKYLQVVADTEILKLCIFTGEDTRFSRKRNPEFQVALNLSLQYANVFGFLSQQHLQECLPILDDRPALLIPYGFNKNIDKEHNRDAIRLLSRMTKNGFKKTGKLLIIDEGESVNSLLEFIDSLDKSLLISREFYVLTSLDISSAPIGRRDIKIVTKDDLTTLLSDNSIEAIISLEYETELKIVRDLLPFNIPSFLRYHPLNLVFEHESPICLFSSIESLAESLNNLDMPQHDILNYSKDGYFKKHRIENLADKIKNTLKKHKNKEFLKFHEDLGFEESNQDIGVFCYFAEVETHRSSARPMRIRAISFYLGQAIPTLKIYGDPRVIRRRIKYLENLLIVNPSKISLIYEETMTVFHKIGLDALNHKVKLLSLVQKYQLNYGVYVRDMHQAYLDYYEIVGQERSVSMYENMAFELNLKAQAAKKVYVPSSDFVAEAINRGVIAYKHQDKFIELSPGIDKRVKLFGSKYTAGTQKLIRIAYAGGLGKFYNFRKFIEALKICNQLPIQLDLYVRRAELENSKEIYGDLKDQKNIHILEGQFTDLAKNRSYDLGLCIFESDLYMKMAAPVKLFDYLSLNIPVLAGKNTYAGNLVEGNNVGFSVNNSVADIVRLLIDITQDRTLLSKKQENISNFIDSNGWKNRVDTIFATLAGGGS